MTVLAEPLRDDPEALKALLLAERAKALRLTQIIKELQRHRFGRRAESLPIDQLQVGLEDGGDKYLGDRSFSWHSFASHSADTVGQAP